MPRTRAIRDCINDDPVRLVWHRQVKLRKKGIHLREDDEHPSLIVIRDVLRFDFGAPMLFNQVSRDKFDFLEELGGLREELVAKGMSTKFYLKLGLNVFNQPGDLGYILFRRLVLPLLGDVLLAVPDDTDQDDLQDKYHNEERVHDRVLSSFFALKAVSPRGHAARSRCRPCASGTYRTAGAP